uniref:Uncharacterized protein n=1 Tax=Helianthus annuus TaxID=4232 RepID=A0A251SHT6_HELAN
MYDGSGEETSGCFCVCSIPTPTSSSGRHAININFRFESGPSCLDSGSSLVHHGTDLVGQVLGLRSDSAQFWSRVWFDSGTGLGSVADSFGSPGSVRSSDPVQSVHVRVWCDGLCSRFSLGL